MYPFFAEKVIGVAITSSKKSSVSDPFHFDADPDLQIEQIPIFVFLIFKVQNSQRGFLLL